MPRIKILTINIHKGFSALNRSFTLSALKKAIHESKAEIVFLQEVIGENKRYSKTVPEWPSQSQYEFLADSIWGEFAYGKNAVYPHGHHGNAILSKFPILSTRHTDISASKAEQRGLLHCELDLKNGKTLHAICIHLGLLKRWRKRQHAQIVTYLGKNVPPSAPVILAGDFNEWRVKPMAPDILHDFSEVTLNGAGIPFSTFPAIKPVFPLDRIFVRGMHFSDVEIGHSKVWKKLSDHCALSAIVKLK